MNPLSCATCKYMSLEMMQGQIQRLMVCHFNPPAMHLITTPQGVQGQTAFPIVQPGHWCGQHATVAPAPIPLDAS